MTRTVLVELFESDNFCVTHRTKKTSNCKIDKDCVYSFKQNCLHSQSTWQNIWQNKVDPLTLFAVSQQPCHSDVHDGKRLSNADIV